MKRLSLIYSLVATILFCGANHLYAGDVWPDGTPLDPWFHKAASRHTPSQYFDITRYGATPDSTRIQTDAIQKAIDEAARNGGTVLVPEGCFVTGALFFKPGTSLHLAKGAVLKGSRDIKDYPDAPVHIEGVVQPYVSAIVNAYNVDGFSISGAGTIDGDGLVWWKAFWDRHKQNPKCTNLEVRRPRMVYICGSNDVSIDGVSFVNSGFWTLHLYKCDKVSICSARISAPMRTPMRAPSTDGVDIDACNNVHIKDCFITSGDDMISIKGGKGPWADTDPGNGTNSCILVENCHFGLGPAVIAVGSECVGVDKLILRNSEVDDADRLLWLKMRPDTPQKYSNIRVDNVSGQAGRVLYIKPWTQFFDLKGRTDLPVSIVDGVEITNCNINCRKERSVVVDTTQYRLENIIMSNNHFGPYDDALAPAFAGKGSVSWEAKWIGVQKHRGPIDLRTTINITGKVKRATAYVSAKGIYQAYVDGRKIGDDLLTPGWTSYNKRIQYQTYDITSMLRRGKSTITATVAPGWYSGGINWGPEKKRYRYGNDLALIMQVEVLYADDRKALFCTDDSWECSPSRITFATIYDGQTTDLTKQPVWTRVEYVKPAGDVPLVPMRNEPVRRMSALKPVKYIVTPAGEKVIDFGQNIAGWERFRIKGEKGDTIVVRHAEILGPDGNFFTTNLRDAKAASTYVLSGDMDNLEPLYTFYGFRYIKLEGLKGEPDLNDFEAVPICSSFENVGSFECSNPVINQLQSNIWWSFHDNFIDVPTDCPQRDERLGWTGDAQVFFRTATFLGNVDKFFRKWLADLSLDQRPGGAIPRVIPDTFPRSKSRVGATGWADCATLIPWQHYMAYGDPSILADQYESMKAWTDCCIREAEPRGWLMNDDLKRHFGDWLSYSLANDPGGLSAVTSKALVAQSFFAGTTRIMARTAAILGKTEDAAYYDKVDSLVRAAYLHEYVTPGGMVMSDTQTAYVLALHFDLLPENMREQAARRLVDNIHRYKDHITTGFLGTPYICEVLTDAGYSDIAYKLLMNEDCPGWLYQVLHGATTIWERWDSIRPDGSIIEGMNSFNHYSFGSIGDWLYRCALGIRETSPGYKTLEINPHPGGGITYMKGSTITPFGKVSVKWTASQDGDMESLELDLPSGTTSLVHLPGGRVRSLKGGHYLFGR